MIEQRSLKSLGQSKPMQEMARYVERIARSDPSAVLLLGESGTGKGWLARRIHELSGRASGPFVEINCAALTASLLENELFGHEKGAFTDAKGVKRGLFEIADRGTVFLDEIGALELALQPRLLNVLESRLFRRIGGTREITVKGRIITASNTDLRAAVAQNEFRADLYYRLNVVTVELPPLRQRSQSDIAQLAERIIGELHHLQPAGPEKISSQALECLVRYDWPGNVRELRNCLERARMMADDDEYVRPEHVLYEVTLGKAPPRSPQQLGTLREMEQEYIERVLADCNGHRSVAARMLGISRATLYNRLQRFGLEEGERTPPTAGVPAQSHTSRNHLRTAERIP